MRTSEGIRKVFAIFWLGFFMAISFLETPLKFTAPGITMAQGVAIGHVIFDALNKAEWVFLLVIIATSIRTFPERSTVIAIGILIVLLSMETFWLLPVLDARAMNFIETGIRGPQALHWVFIAAEILKIPMLLWIGWPETEKKISI